MTWEPPDFKTGRSRPSISMCWMNRCWKWHSCRKPKWVLSGYFEPGLLLISLPAVSFVTSHILCAPRVSSASCPVASMSWPRAKRRWMWQGGGRRVSSDLGLCSCNFGVESWLPGCFSHSASWLGPQAGLDWKLWVVFFAKQDRYEAPFPGCLDLAYRPVAYLSLSWEEGPC